MDPGPLQVGRRHRVVHPLQVSCLAPRPHALHMSVPVVCILMVGFEVVMVGFEVVSGEKCSKSQMKLVRLQVLSSGKGERGIAQSMLAFMHWQGCALEFDLVLWGMLDHVSHSCGPVVFCMLQICS